MTMEKSTANITESNRSTKMVERREKKLQSSIMTSKMTIDINTGLRRWLFVRYDELLLNRLQLFFCLFIVYIHICEWCVTMCFSSIFFVPFEAFKCSSADYDSFERKSQQFGRWIGSTQKNPIHMRE